MVPPNGLMVQVIQDCDKKDAFQISQEMGGRYFTPIIDAPEVAILSVCCTTIEPKWDGKTIHPHPTLGRASAWQPKWHTAVARTCRRRRNKAGCTSARTLTGSGLFA